MRIVCEVEEVELDGDHAAVDGLCVTCSRCGHEAEVYGTSDRSLRRAFVMLREECPLGEGNYYTGGSAEEDV